MSQQVASIKMNPASTPILYDITTDKFRLVTQVDWDRLNERAGKLEMAFKAAVGTLNA